MMRAIVTGLAFAVALAGQPAEVLSLVMPAPAGFFLLAKNGKVCAAVAEDQKLRVWSLPDGRAIRTLDLGKRHLDTAVISDDGVWLAAGDHEGQYTVWNLSSGGEQLHLQMAYYPFALAFSPDGKRLAIAPAGEPVQVYDLESKKKLLELPRTTGGTQSLVFSRDGARIGTADSDTAVRIYDGRNGELLARNTDFLVEPLAAAFTVDGKHLIAAGGDKAIAWVDASTGKVTRKSQKLSDPVAYLSVSPDGKLIAAALLHADNMLMPATVLISETESGRQVQEWMPPTRISGGGWTMDGHLLAATGNDKALRIWRVR